MPPRDDEGGDGAGPSRAVGEVGPSEAAGGEAGPLGAVDEGRGPVTRARRLQIVRRSGEMVAALAAERRDTLGAKVVAKEVPEEEVPAASRVPDGEAVARVEEPVTTPGET